MSRNKSRQKCVQVEKGGKPNDKKTLEIKLVEQMLKISVLPLNNLKHFAEKKMALVE